MHGKFLRDSIIIAGIAMGCAYAAIHKDQIYDRLGITITATPNTEATAQVAHQGGQALPVTKIQGVAVSIPKNKVDGHYWTNARVNNGVINFLVDTGASTVALTPEDARRAGINMNELQYNVPVATAAGQNVAASVQLKSISVGPVTLRNVRAIVVPEGLSTSLLGMSFLGQLQKVEATPHALILRL